MLIDNIASVVMPFKSGLHLHSYTLMTKYCDFTHQFYSTIGSVTSKSLVSLKKIPFYHLPLPHWLCCQVLAGYITADLNSTWWSDGFEVVYTDFRKAFDDCRLAKVKVKPCRMQGRVEDWRLGCNRTQQLLDHNFLHVTGHPVTGKMWRGDLCSCW